MALSIGIVGLPNVGKSTLFNALTRAQNAEAANYPLCTIEPNKATVPVPDARVDALTELVRPAKTIYATVDFIDIAGLVRGASKGEGLGNQFLANIRECAAIVEVVRCFEDENITHVDGSVDPLRDVETIETELLLADIDSVTKRLERLQMCIRDRIRAGLDPAGALMLLALLVVVIAALKGRHIIEALIYGNVCAAAIGMLIGNIAPSQIFGIPAQNGASTGIIQDGIDSVVGAIIFAILILAVTQILVECGIMRRILDFAHQTLISSVRQAELFIIGVTIIASIPISANAPAELLVGPTLVRPIGEKFRLSAARRANLMDCAVCTLSLIHISPEIRSRFAHAGTAGPAPGGRRSESSVVIERFWRSFQAPAGTDELIRLRPRDTRFHRRFPCNVI